MLYQGVKRVFDLFCAIVGIIITLPLWLLAIMGITLSDPGPLFYVAHRIGKNNCAFRMYKFRSMSVAKDSDESSLRADSSRIFPFGEFLRKTKIDELPQLLNVFNGTMSIIGPRPVAEDQKSLFRVGKWDEAANVRVGLSGPAALYDYLYGDQFTDEAEYMEKVFPTRRELEYSYVQRKSIQYDLKMIVYTILAIVYTILGKKCDWMLDELIETAKETMQ